LSIWELPSFFRRDRDPSGKAQGLPAEFGRACPRQIALFQAHWRAIL